ncbi:MAG: helix-turn-helix transcriptional regulator [Alphaproteobacteria bacterium]|nr:helix-turn-helix transcriptional regulator [Alphaproteobacteria bacterium]
MENALITMNISERLRAVRGHMKRNQDEMTEWAGLGLGGWKRLETEGRLPKDDVLRRLHSEGISIDWLVTGAGHMLRDAERPAAPIDPALMGRIVDTIRGTYKRLGQGVPDRTLGELAAQWYGEIAGAGDQADQLVALGVRAEQFRQTLTTAAAAPGADKRQA